MGCLAFIGYMVAIFGFSWLEYRGDPEHAPLWNALYWIVAVSYVLYQIADTRWGRRQARRFHEWSWPYAEAIYEWIDARILAPAEALFNRIRRIFERRA